jgi:hypothetical protein
VLIYKLKKLILYPVLTSHLSHWGVGKEGDRSSMSADTETSATFRRTTAVHPKGRGKAKKYALSRVVMPEDARPRGTRIDVRDCVRTLQDALEERGWTEGVLLASASAVENGELSVLSLRVNDSVQDKAALYRFFDGLVEGLMLTGDTLTSASTAAKRSTSRSEKGTMGRRPPSVRLATAGVRTR